MLLMLNDAVTKLTEHYGLVLGIIILLFALGLRKGFVDYLAEWWWRMRKGTGVAPATPLAVDRGVPAQPMKVPGE